MSQHGRFEQDYLRMKVQIDKLKASGLSEEQRTIFSKLDKMIQHFEHHLFTEYIDFEEICDNLPDAIYVASPTVRPFMSMIPTPSSAVSRKQRLLVKMFTRSIVRRNFTPMVSFPPF